MARPLKYFLVFVGVLLLLVVGTAVAVTVLFDPNDYRDEISATVGENTGRDLKLGEVSLRLFPFLGASARNVQLANADGFGPNPMVEVGELEVGVQLLPLLLRQEVHIGTIRVHGLRVNLEQRPDRNNWEDLEAKDEGDAAPDRAPPPSPSAQPQVGVIEVEGLDIVDAAIVYSSTSADGQVTRQAVESLNFRTGRLAKDQPVKFELSVVVSSSEPAVTATIGLESTLNADIEAQRFEFNPLQLDLLVTLEDGRQVAMQGGGRLVSDDAAGRVSLSDGRLALAGMELALSAEALTPVDGTASFSGSLASQSFNLRESMRQLGVTPPTTADASALSKASLAAKFSGSADAVAIRDLALALDDSQATGEADLQLAGDAPQVQFKLGIDFLDADRYLAPKDSAATGKTGDAGSGSVLDTEIPVEALDAVDAKGTVNLGALTINGIRMESVNLALDAKRGQVKTVDLTAKGFDGRLKQQARITPGPDPRYQVSVVLDQINSTSVLKLFTDQPWLSGLGDLTLDFSGRGATLGAVLQSMSGTAAAGLANGALEGFNLRQTVSQARAAYKGEPVPAGDREKRTSFRDVKGAGTIENGVLKTKSLDASGEGYQLRGGGDINLVSQQINYELRPTVSGAEFKDLDGLTVPVRLTGSLFDPKVKVDLEGALKQKAKQEVKQEVKKQEDKLKKKLGDKLGDFLKKN